METAFLNLTSLLNLSHHKELRPIHINPFNGRFTRKKVLKREYLSDRSIRRLCRLYAVDYCCLGIIDNLPLKCKKVVMGICKRNTTFWMGVDVDLVEPSSGPHMYGAEKMAVINYLESKSYNP